MSSVYLVRHGQAGLRQRYDELSPLGRRQARLLGCYLARQRVTLAGMWCGALTRQRQTAEEVRQAYIEAGVAAPEIGVDEDWNEFDLDGVYREMAPVLAAGDPEFRREYEELMRLMADETHAVHHTWSRCDIAVAKAWIEGRDAHSIETWAEFRARVLRATAAFEPRPDGEAVAVFTSATPIAVWTGKVLGCPDGSLMRLAGVMYNSAITTVRTRENDLALFSFNGVPHLDEPALRSFR